MWLAVSTFTILLNLSLALEASPVFFGGTLINNLTFTKVQIPARHMKCTDYADSPYITFEINPTVEFNMAQLTDGGIGIDVNIGMEQTWSDSFNVTLCYNSNVPWIFYVGVGLWNTK